MVSIRDVAKHAGVAISTVSKVLNNYPNVTEETKKKVNAAIAELNFVPNTVAAALSSKQTGRIALLIHLNTSTQAIDEISMQYLAGAIHQAKQLGLDVVTIFFSMLQDMSVEEITVYLRSQNIAGLVIYGLSRKDLVLQKLVEAKFFKIVLVDAPLINQNTSCVWIDQEDAQYAVAKKTIEMGSIPYRKILYISGKKDGYVTAKRMKGMERLAKELELSVYTRCGSFSELEARNITFRYARKQDLIVCASDLMAIGAMRALMEMDIFRPVCGFDGITLMGYAGKQMNTVKQDFAGISSEAVKELHWLLSGGDGREIVLEYSLVRMEYMDIIR